MAAISLRTHAAHFPAAVKNVLVIVSEPADARATASILASIYAANRSACTSSVMETPPSGYARRLLPRRRGPARAAAR